MSESRLLGSVVRALDYYPGRLGSNPAMGGNFFQLCFIPLCFFFLSFFRYVLTSEEDVRRGSVNECKRGLAENKRGAQLRKRIYRCERRVSIVKR